VLAGGVSAGKDIKRVKILFNMTSVHKISSSFLPADDPLRLGPHVNDARAVSGGCCCMVMAGLGMFELRNGPWRQVSACGGHNVR